MIYGQYHYKTEKGMIDFPFKLPENTEWFWINLKDSKGNEYIFISSESAAEDEYEELEITEKAPFELVGEKCIVPGFVTERKGEEIILMGMGSYIEVIAESDYQSEVDDLIENLKLFAE